MYVGGGATAAALFFLLRRRQNHARKPMIARPMMGPMTAPAIQALLEDFFSSMSGTWVGEVVSLSPLLSEVVAAVVGPTAEDPMKRVSRAKDCRCR